MLSLHAERRVRVAWGAMMSTLCSGLLAGWKRQQLTHCLVVTLQTVDDQTDPQNPVFNKVALGISDEMLCSLARDLTRAASARGFDIWGPEPLRRPMGVVDRMLRRMLASRYHRNSPIALLPKPPARPLEQNLMRDDVRLSA